MRGGPPHTNIQASEHETRSQPNQRLTELPAATGTLPVDAPEVDESNDVRVQKTGRSRLRKTSIFMVKLVLATLLLVWLVRSGRLDFGVLSGLRLSPESALLLALVLGSLALPALRWWWLLRIQRLDESLWRVTVLTWLGYFTALVLPGAASGDLVRGYLMVRRQPGSRARAFSTILVDRFVGLYSLVVVGMFAGILILSTQDARTAVQSVVGITALLVVGMTAMALAPLSCRCRKYLLRMLPPKWREAWNESFDLYRGDKMGLLGCFLLAAASSSLTFASFSVAASLLGETLTWQSTFLAGPLIVLANCLPITPGGVGLAEATASELFAGLGSLHGAEAMLLLRLCGMLLSLPGAVAIVSRVGAARTERIERRRKTQCLSDGVKAIVEEVQVP